MTIEAVDRREFPTDPRSVSGLIAIVTGAASGMGAATAELMAADGAKVVVADLGADRVEPVAARLRSEYGDDAVLGVECDVADHDALRRLVEATVEAFGGIDIVVNNAGVALPGGFLGGDEAEFEANWAMTLDVNLTAHVRLVRLAMPYLQLSPSPRIVNIASTEAIVSTPGLAAYSATKAGVTGITKSMAVELGKHGITANCICPGPIATGMTAEIPDDLKATYARRRVPLRRYGAPAEVGHMTLNLCLPSSTYITGATIPVDGGMTIRHT